MTDLDKEHIDVGLGDDDGEKRKRKRKRVKKSSSEQDEEVEADGDKKSSKISGGSGDIVGESSAPPGASVYTNDRTVYIEGLPFEASESDVRQFFSKAGGKIKDVRLPTWHDSGRLRGYGHVEFESGETAEKALDMDGSYMMKRYIKVAKPMVPRILQSAAAAAASGGPKPTGCKSVFVKNIPYDSTEDDIKEAFKVFGPIVNVRLAVWGHTNQLKGFGYVDFKREDSAGIAIKKTGTVTVKGRPVLIDYETGAPKMSFKGGGGGGKKK